MSKEQGLGSKIKSLFSKSKPLRQTDTKIEQRLPFVITNEHIQDISANSPSNARERKILELTDLVTQTRLEPTASQALTQAIEDLLVDNDRSKRHLALRFIHAIIKGQVILRFIHAIIKGQDEDLGILREYYFHLISRHTQRDDHFLCLDILCSLTKDGQNLIYIDQQIGDLLVRWLNDYTQSDEKSKFLELLVNVIKYNSAFIDEDHVMELFKLSCSICNKTLSEEEIKLCLLLLESIIKYYYIRSECLMPLCMTLSRIVLYEKFSQASWKLMRVLLATHLGHSALVTLSDILKNRDNRNDGALLRGAIFFIGMALWGSQRVDTLIISATAVLPSFKAALISENLKVAFEVSTMTLRLVRKFGKTQPGVLWDTVLDILSIMHDLIQKGSVGEGQIIGRISNNLHDILTAMEELVDNSTYSTAPDRLFDFIEKCAASRPEASVMTLLEYRSESCRPKDDRWLDNLEKLLQKYFRAETRTVVRLKALQVLNQILSTNKMLYEDQLLDLLISTFTHIHQDPDIRVRCQAVSMLVEQTKSCTSRKSAELIDLIQKVCDRDPESVMKAELSNLTADATKCCDVLDAIKGLIEIFRCKLCELRASLAITPMEILITHLQQHYIKGWKSKSASQIRKPILSLLLELRADTNGRIRLEGGSYSPGLYSVEDFLPPDIHTNAEDCHNVCDVRVLDITSVLNMINKCLQKENDWDVLSHVLKKMPTQWQNKTLVLSADSSMIDNICQTLCTLLKENELKRLTAGTPAVFKKSDFDAAIFPVLTCMTAYSPSLLTSKSELVKCLEFGLISKQARICVHTLRVCCLEMEGIMIKMLPSILNKLSQIAANKDMSLALLMFLSCLVRLPKLYKNFNADQYRFIFAIALPYTNPALYQHYAVYLAYHVIIMWFVKCRMMYRKQFVQQIIKNIQTNMKDYKMTASQTDLHKDPGNVDATLLFHQELQETCIDILSRYTFSNCSSLPKRTQVTNFLLEGGKSQSWFLGNKLVTITTSGGASKVTKTGLCQRCTSSVKGEATVSQQSANQMSVSSGRRRHRSDAVRAQPRPSRESFSQDDIEIHKIDSISEDSNAGHMTNSSKKSGNSADDITDLTALAAGGGSYNSGQCNCWCNGWAEIYIRRPSGDTSWILRIQNKQLFNHEDFPLSDISSLFMPSPHKSPFPYSAASHSQQKIESGLLEEKEYVEQHEKYFNQNLTSSAARRKINLVEEDSEGSDKEPLSPNRNFSNPEFLSRRSPLVDGSGVATGGVASVAVTSGSTGDLIVRAQSPLIYTQTSAAPAAASHILGGRASAFTRQTSLNSLDADDAPIMFGTSVPTIGHVRFADDLHASSESDDCHSDILPAIKQRSHTISYPSAVVSPEGLPWVKKLNSQAASAAGDSVTGLLPSFVFLQLYHMGLIHCTNAPLAIPEGNEDFKRGLRNLERMAPYETHKVGVLYVGKGQVADESAILCNQYGSRRYSLFLKQLGQLLALKNCDPRDMYIGGLDHEEEQDGRYTYAWHDEVVQMVFHVATMMPTKDTKCNDKKRHIGNDYVTIVYNDSGEKYTMGTIKGQFNYVNIILEPLDQVSHAVSILCKDEISHILDHVSTTRVISDDHLGNLVKQIALHSSMASIIYDRGRNKELFASNWLERLRQIKRMRDKVQPASVNTSHASHYASSRGQHGHDSVISDFTEYV